jgi:hypothetical protein
MEAIINGRRYNLDKCCKVDGASGPYGTGITLEGVYVTPNSKEVIVHTYSIWQRRGTTGECVGDVYHIADEWETAGLASRFGGELVELVPEADC